MPSAFIPSVHNYPAVPLARQLVHQRYVHPGPLVLRTAPLKYPAPATDRDRTVSRRSEPSSRTALMGEQPNPWNRLQLQDAMSRHRGAKPPRRCGLLGEISLLSPGQLLSVERRQFHSHTAGSLTPTFVTARLVSLAVRLTYAFTLFARFPAALSQPLSASVTLSEATAPVKLSAWHCPVTGLRPPVRIPVYKEWYPKGDSTKTGVLASQSPTYSVHYIPKSSTKLQ